MPASGVATTASPSPAPARASSCGVMTFSPGCAKVPVMPTGDWPENRLNFFASARTAMSTPSLRKLKPPRPRMTFLVVSIRIGSAAASPPRTVKATSPQLIRTGSFS